MSTAATLRRAVKRGLGKVVLVPPGKRTIFVYHDVSDPGAPQHTVEYSTPIALFRAQIDVLARSFTFVTLDDLVGGAGGGRRLASITFDDGYLSLCDQVLPELSSRGIPFTVFLNGSAVTANQLDYGPAYAHLNRRYGEKVFLDEDDVRALSAAGVTVGSHGWDHRPVAGLDEAGRQAQIGANKTYLESLLGQAVRHFALPFGKRQHYDPQVVDYCHGIGHTYVYSTNPTFFDPADLPAGGQLLPRVELAREPTEMIGFMLNRPLLRRVDL